METNKPCELIRWLENYRQWKYFHPMPDTTVFSQELTNNLDVLYEFYFADGMNILHISTKRNHLTVVAELVKVMSREAINRLLSIKDAYGNTAIQYAAGYNRYEILTNILSSVRDGGTSPIQLLLVPDSYGYTAAHLAAHNNNYHVIESMLRGLTNSDERLQLLMTRGESGRTVLHIAASYGSTQTVNSILLYIRGDNFCQLLKIRDDEESSTVLHTAAYHENTELMEALIKPLVADAQTLELLEMRDSPGNTAKEKALRIENSEVALLLDEKTTITLMEKMRTASDHNVRQTLLERLIDQPLTSKQLKELYPQLTQYAIPRNQKNIRQQALIFYNEDDREGAEEEADNLYESLITTGCGVIKQVWTGVSQLQLILTNNLLQTCDTSSILIICLMSHGSMGCLQGSDGTVSINSILKQVCDFLPPLVPLIVLIQACQGSRHGIALQALNETEILPEVSELPMTLQRTTDPPEVHISVSEMDTKIDLTRPHTVLLQATVTGGVAYRGEYTGALADQIRKANGKISIYEMHQQAVMEIETLYGSEQSPKITSTLKRNLLFPGI